MKATITIMWASVKYYARKIKEFFVEPELTKSDIQRKLYWSAYQNWSQQTRNIGTDLFEEKTNCSAFYKKRPTRMNPVRKS